MTQSTMNFDVPFVRHSETSRIAAEQHAPTAASMELLALRLFREAGEHGLTDFQLRELMGDYESARPRRCGLLKKGLIRDSGRTRLNDRGNAATIWISTTEG